MLLEDLDRVMEIEPQAFGTHCWSRESFVMELGNDLATYLVAEDKELKTVIGYGGCWKVIDEMHITTLGTDPNHRRKYAAESIIAAFIAEAIRDNVRGITLEVRISNVPAQRLYEKYGFQRQGVRKRYYQDNYEDALLLWTEDVQDKKFQECYQANLKLLAEK